MVQKPYLAYAIGTFAIIGAYKVAKGSLGMLSYMNRHMIRGRPDLSKYNKGDSWAVVTAGKNS